MIYLEVKRWILSVVTLFPRPTAQKENQVQYVDSVEKLNQLCITRRMLAMFAHLAFLPQVIVNCLVRIGVPTATGEAKSGVARITGVGKVDEEYDLENVKTKKVLLLGSKRTMKGMQYVSNQRVTQEEFLVWKKGFTDRGIPLPTMEDVEKKQKLVQKAIDWMEAKKKKENKVEEKKVSKPPMNPVMYKISLIQEKRMAESHDDFVTAHELSKEIAEIDERRMALYHEQNPTLVKMAYHNSKVRTSNIERAIEHRTVSSLSKKCTVLSISFIIIVSCLLQEYFKELATKKRKYDMFTSKPTHYRYEDLDIDGDWSEVGLAPHVLESLRRKKAREAEMKKKPLDMYEVHNFEIDIDLLLTESEYSCECQVLNRAFKNQVLEIVESGLSFQFHSISNVQFPERTVKFEIQVFHLKMYQQKLACFEFTNLILCK